MVKVQLMTATGLLVALVFVFGVIVGNMYASSTSTHVIRLLQASELNTESFIIEQELLEAHGAGCDLAQARLGTLSHELWQLGKLLDTPSAKSDLGEEKYGYLKRKFHLQQIRTYLLYLRLHDRCGAQSNVALFFYSQSDPSSREQGAALDRLVATHNVTVFAIEANYSGELRFLEDYYNVTGTPAVVLNFGHAQMGFQAYESLERELAKI